MEYKNTSSSVIKEMLDINYSINLEFRESKYPLFFRKLISNMKRNKLKKVVSKIKNNNSLPISILIEYMTYLSLLTEEELSKVHCIFVDKDIEYGSLGGDFKLKVSDEDYLFIMVRPRNTEDELSYFIKYQYTHKGTTKFIFSDSNVEFISNTGKHKSESYPYKSSVEQQVARDLFCETIINDIYDFIMASIIRSERIVKDHEFINGK